MTAASTEPPFEHSLEPSSPSMEPGELPPSAPERSAASARPEPGSDGGSAADAPTAASDSEASASPPDEPAARTASSAPGRAPSAAPVLLRGELAAAPRAAPITVVLGITGILLITSLWRLFARWVLVVRRPAELTLSQGALIVTARTEVLGRTLRERQIVVPAGALMRATREVLYPAFGLYVGLLALALGSYFGVALTVDGLRAASASMLGLGLVVVALGIGIDFVLTSLLPGRAGRSRLVLLARRGRPITLTLVEARDADRLLSVLREQVSPRAAEQHESAAGRENQPSPSEP